MNSNELRLQHVVLNREVDDEDGEDADPAGCGSKARKTAPKVLS